MKAQSRSVTSDYRKGDQARAARDDNNRRINPTIKAA